MRAIFILFLFIQITVFSQNNSPGFHNVRNYLPEEYKSAVQNWGIVQDSRGVMYFGNNEGVLMYDGIEWTTIKTPNNSIVRALNINEKNIVFVGASSEFGYLAPNQFGNLKYVSLSDQLDSLNYCTEEIKTILTYKNDVWFCSYDRIYHYKDLKSHGVVNLEPKSAFFTSIVDSVVYPTDYFEGIQYLDEDTVRSLEKADFFQEKSIFTILKLDDDELLVTTYGSGVFRFNFKTGEVLPFLKGKAKEFQEENSLYHASLLSDHHYVFSSIYKGVLITDLDGNLIANYNKEKGLINETVTFSYQKDINQPLWLTSDEGINKIDIAVPFKIIKEKNGLKGNIYDITVFNKRIIVATSLGVFYSNTDHSGDYYFKQFEELNQQTWKLFPYVDFDSREYLIVATQSGTYEINDNLNIIKVEKQIKEIEERSMQGRNIYRSKYQPNLFYLGTERGIVVFSKDKGKWSILNDQTLDIEVRFVYETDENSLWLASYYDGLRKINTKDSSILIYGLEKGLPSLNDNRFSSINDTLLILGEGGVFYYNSEKDSIMSYHYIDQITDIKSRKVSFFQSTSYTDLWLALFNNKSDKSEIRHLFQDDSKVWKIDTLIFGYLPKPDIDFDAMFINNQYTIFGKGNAIYFYSKDYSFNPNHPFKALIREIKLEEQDSVLFGGAFFELDKDLNINVLSNKQPAHLKYSLKYKYNDLTFYVASPYFTNEDKIEFRYFLEGDDNKWSAWTAEPKSVKNNLREGKYKFNVEARNVFGIVSEKATFEFEILPPWYRSILAFIFYVIAFVAFVWGVVKWNTHRLVQEKIQLEKIVAERTAEVRKQKEEIEGQKQEIEDSIHYASRIQRAVLPRQERLDANFQDYFILFKPRDIVSGDFYWMGEKDNKVVLVAADCTGHGVPGAFMSMLGVSFLNDIVNKNDVVQANIILNQLRTNVKTMLKQEGREGEAKDGMDISLVIIDFDKMKMQYAGAYNPLYLYRSKELIEYKADKMPIGIYIKEKESFTNNEIDIQKGDAIYIFSDGFVDQFGGPDERKFMTKNFKELLGEICEKPMSEQREILDKTNVDWRGEIEQIDDIIVIGVRI